MRATRAKDVFMRQRALRAYVLTCQRALHAYVLTCQRALRAYVLTCQRALRAYVLKCQGALRAYWQLALCAHVQKVSTGLFFIISSFFFLKKSSILEFAVIIELFVTLSSSKARSKMLECSSTYARA